MAGYLSATQLAALQAVQSAAMDVAGIVVKRVTRTSTGNGLNSESWRVIATVTGGWAKPTASIMQQYATLIGSDALWVVRLPYGTSCLNGDRLVMPSGETLTVQADLSQHSYDTCKRVLASAIR